MKILLLGANGQVGFELQRALAPLGDLIPATRSGKLPGGADCLAADLNDAESLAHALESTQCDLIVNAAAYTAVDRAEDEEPFAQRANADALGEIGAWALRHNALVVHYSTDYVFDGQAARAYREDDPTGPLGVYGRTKLAGEQSLRSSGCDYLILRTAWVYGARGQNFLRTMLRLAREHERLTVVDDQHGAPTTSKLIAASTAAMLARWLAVADRRERARYNGTYHLAAAGETTWCGFARAIVTGAARAGLLERMPEVAAIRTADFPTKARRPAYSVLNTSKLRERFDLHLPDWQTGLDDTLAELREK